MATLRIGGPTRRVSWGRSGPSSTRFHRQVFDGSSGMVRDNGRRRGIQMIRASILFMALTTLTLTACGSKKGDGGSSGDKPATLKLPKTDNLQIDVPGEATVGDGIMGDGNM